jgi:replicative DNA helicase
MGASGWREAGDLVAGDRIALARRLAEPEKSTTWSDDRLALLGQLVGDGSYLSGQPLRYTTASEENSAAVRGAAEREFGSKVTRYVGRGRWHQLLLSGNGNRWRPAGMNRWLRELGIFGQRSYEKRLPEEVYRLANRQIAVLLQHLWATDGTVHLHRQGRGGAAAVVFSTSSRGLAADVAALLLRFGIVARIHRVDQGKYRPMFTVGVSGAADQLRFATHVGGFGPRRAAIDELLRRLASIESNTNVDTLPQEVFAEVRAAMSASGITQRRMAALGGTSYGGGAHFNFAPSREVVREYADLLRSDSLRAAAQSDLFWDRVIEVVEAGEEEVFDLSVPGPACWLADGIVSHNSGALEQDADLVAFIYRDEVYNKLEDESNKRLAELIIAKHRNGETGTVPLVFFGETTTFKSQSKHEGAPPF